MNSTFVGDNHLISPTVSSMTKPSTGTPQQMRMQVQALVAATTQLQEKNLKLTWILKKCIESQGQQEQMIKDQQIQMKQSKELFESNKTKFTNECTEQIKEHLQKIKRNHESEINRLKQELQSKHDDEMHRLKEDLQSTQHEDPITTFFSNSELKDILKIWEDTKTNTKKRTVQEKQQTNHDTKNKDPTRKKQKVPNPMLTGVIQRTVLVGKDEDEDEGILVF